MTIRIDAKRKDGKLNVTYGFSNGRQIKAVITREKYAEDMAHEMEIRAAEAARAKGE